MQLMRGEPHGMGILARLTVLAYLLVVVLMLVVIGAYVLLVKRWSAKSFM